MVELTKKFSVPFCVDFEGRQINCLVVKSRLFVSSADLERECGRQFPSVNMKVLGMDEAVMGFTELSEVKKAGIPKPLFNLLSSLTPEEGEKAIKEAFGL